MTITPIKHNNDQQDGDHEQHRLDEPSQCRQAEIIGVETTVKIAGGARQNTCRALRVLRSGFVVALGRQWRRANDDQGCVVLAQTPSEFENP